MHNIDSVFAECKNELQNLNIIYGNSIIQYDKHIVDFGYTEIKDDVFYIFINPILLDDDVDINILKETILHELLHTVEGCMNHGKKWKEFVLKVNAAYGYNITTKINSSILHQINYHQNIEWKYIVQCKNCNEVHFRRRKCDFVTDINLYQCLVCGGINTLEVVAAGKKECKNWLSQQDKERIL